MAAKSSATRRAPAKKPASRKTPQKPPPGDTPALEWIAAGVGLIIITTVFVLLVIQGLGAGDEARLTARVVERTGSQVTVELANQGGGAASAIEVEGQAGETSGSVTIDYVPGRSRRTAVIVLDTPPAVPVAVKVKGYQLP